MEGKFVPNFIQSTLQMTHSKQAYDMPHDGHDICDIHI